MKNKDEIIIYQNKENNISLSVCLEDENVWLTQANLVELYQSNKSNVSEHIKHIFEECELEDLSTKKDIYVAKNENPRYILDLLLAVIAVSVETVEIVDGLPKVEWG